MPRRALRPGALVTLAAALLAGGCASVPETKPCCDVIVAGGDILDGTGKSPFRADIGIAGGRIVFVGARGDRTAGRIIDARGLIVAPGFIDAHNHSDERITEPGHRLNENFLRQGVTTIVGGADGLFAPSQLQTKIAQFERQGVGTNYAFYVGHNGIRSEIMADPRRTPTDAEMEAMRARVREGMQMGAVGLSTGLMYEPGLFSTIDEVVTLTREIAPYHGIYDSHTRDPARQMLASEAEAIEIGRRAGVPVKLAHLKAAGQRNAGRIGEVIALVAAARADGRIVVADQYPYDGAATLYLHEFLVIDPRQTEGAPPPLAAVREALRDGARRETIRTWSEDGVNGGFTWLKAAGYDGIRIVHSPARPVHEGQYLVDLARTHGKTPFDELATLVAESADPILVTGAAIQERDVRDVLLQPWVMVASDGEYLVEGMRAHPRYSGTFPRVLGHYARDLRLIGLADAVRRMTALPAAFLGLHDRGRLCAGLVADLTIFDPRRVQDNASWTRPHTPPSGIEFVLVNGQVAVDRARITGVTAGTIVQRQRPSLADDCDIQLSTVDR